MLKNAESHLRMARQMTAAAWAAHVGWEDRRWLIHASVGLPKKKADLLAQSLGGLKLNDWLARPRASLPGKPLRLQKIPGLGATQLFVFCLGPREALLVGARAQSKAHERIWQLVGGLLSAASSSGSQFGRLEESVRDLQAAQLEAAARLAAQRDAESRLVQAAKLAAVGEMAAGIAHELNNPLTTVTGFAELLLDETPSDAPFRADLEMVMHEALRARGVVRRLLDFARQGEKSRARLDLNEILDDVLALTTHFIHTSGVQLTRITPPDLPWITVDANQMKQVFLNLIHNALHAMPVGGRLDIRADVRPRQDREWLVVAVADSGTGIDPTDLDRIFEPFFTTRGDHGGTGLGLSVTYGIVADHGGTIEVESQPGAGSTFSVWLPT